MSCRPPVACAKCGAPLGRVITDLEVQDPHGGCSSVVEHWIVAPVVAGSIPVSHPDKNEERGRDERPQLFGSSAQHNSFENSGSLREISE